MELKQRLQKIGICFLIGVILLTFLSKTISSALMTKVTAEYPKYQQLIKKAEAEGEIELEKEYTIYAPANSKVKEVMIKENAEVKVGDLLCILDLSDIQYEIKEKSLELEKAQVQMESNVKKISTIDEKINKVKNDLQEIKERKQEAAVVDSLQVNEADQLEVEHLKDNVQIKQSLYDIGAASEEEVKKAQLELKQKEIDLLKAQQGQLKEKQNEDERLEEKQDNLNEKLQSLQEEKETLLSNNETQEIEMKRLKINEEKLQEKIASKGEVYATEGGKVRSMSVEKGKSIVEGSELFKIGITDEGYRINVKVGKNIDFIHIGDEVELTIKSIQKNDVKGKITAIEKENDMQNVKIAFNEIGLYGGEKAKVYFVQKSKDEQNIFSYVSLQKDNKGYFIYLLKKVKSPLGEDYVVTRKDVQVIDESDSQIAVSDQIQDNEMILVSSEKAVKPGERVKVENETTLLENQK